MESPISSTTDTTAPYDGGNIADTPVGRLQRRAVHRYLRERVLKDSSSLAVLDLGCGSGDDALFLASEGHRVHAVDNRNEHLDVARSRAEAQGVVDQIHFLHMDIKDCHGVHFPSPFDLVLSDFGVLNYLSPEDVISLARAAASWVRSGGRLILVVMPRCCLWETAYFLARGPRSSAWRRARRGPVKTPSGDGRSGNTWYHGTRFLAQAFAPAFEVIRTRPVGLVVPPCHLGAFGGDRFSGVLSALAGVDSILGPIPGLSGLADHCLIDLRRTTATLLENSASLRQLAVVGQTAPAGASSNGATPRVATPCR